MITDIKSGRLAGIRKETFEDLLRATDIPAKYYCRTSFVTWDVLLPNEELATKLAGGNITSKYFRLQPEYTGKRKIKIIVCNVPIQLNEEVLAAYLSGYGDIEEVVKAKSANETAHGDYIFTMFPDMGGGSWQYPILSTMRVKLWRWSLRVGSPSVGTVNNWGISPNPALKRPPKLQHQRQQWRRPRRL